MLRLQIQSTNAIDFNLRTFLLSYTFQHLFSIYFSQIVFLISVLEPPTIYNAMFI